jgi:3-dehydroquinate dehydratase type I
MSSLCLTLAEHSGASLQQKINQYCDQVEFIEVRLDYLDDKAVPALPCVRATKFIATCRPPREGGLFRGTEAERFSVLESAVKAGFDWIDLEKDVPLTELSAFSTQIIRSSHFFDSFPLELSDVLDELMESGGDAFKIAARISTTSELIKLLSWVESLPTEIPRVVLGMGELGQVSRIMGPFLRNLWTYVIEAGGSEVAPGQFSLDEAQQVFRVGHWDASTGLFLLAGSRAPSPEFVRLFNVLFEHYGYSGVALPCMVDDLSALEEYVARSRLPYRGIGDCGTFEGGTSEATVEDTKHEMLVARVTGQFLQWTDIDPDEDLIRGSIGG